VEPPDTLEKGIRFGCGFFFGCVAVLAGTLYIGSGHRLVAFCLVIGLLFGLAAMKFGDSFWNWISGWWTWL
jgi:hypothetical protein